MKSSIRYFGIAFIITSTFSCVASRAAGDDWKGPGDMTLKHLDYPYADRKGAAPCPGDRTIQNEVDPVLAALKDGTSGSIPPEIMGAVIAVSGTQRIVRDIFYRNGPTSPYANCQIACLTVPDGKKIVHLQNGRIDTHFLVVKVPEKTENTRKDGDYAPFVEGQADAGKFPDLYFDTEFLENPVKVTGKDGKAFDSVVVCRRARNWSAENHVVTFRIHVIDK